MRFLHYAEIKPNEEPRSASYATISGDPKKFNKIKWQIYDKTAGYATLRGGQQVYPQFYERRPGRRTDSFA